MRSGERERDGARVRVLRLDRLVFRDDSAGRAIAFPVRRGKRRTAGRATVVLPAEEGTAGAHFGSLRKHLRQSCRRYPLIRPVSVETFVLQRKQARRTP